MAIEYAHRLTTILDTLAVLALVAWAFAAFPRRDPVRRYSVLSLFFLLMEALLGAGLVLFRYVAKDQSAGRVWYLSGHLTNTMLLLAALSITAWLALCGREHFTISSIATRIRAALLIIIFVSVTGTVAALGDTLFPAASLAGGLQQDFSSTSNILLRLRFLHPILAVLAAAYLLWLAAGVMRHSIPGTSEHRAATRVMAATLFQVVLGGINLSLLAPLWAQLSHLLLADLVWVVTLLLALETGKVALLEFTTFTARM